MEWSGLRGGGEREGRVGLEDSPFFANDVCVLCMVFGLPRYSTSCVQSFHAFVCMSELLGYMTFVCASACTSTNLGMCIACRSFAVRYQHEHCLLGSTSVVVTRKACLLQSSLPGR